MTTKQIERIAAESAERAYVSSGNDHQSARIAALTELLLHGYPDNEETQEEAESITHSMRNDRKERGLSYCS